jgi:hypothetical protein
MELYGISERHVPERSDSHWEASLTLLGDEVDGAAVRMPD